MKATIATLQFAQKASACGAAIKAANRRIGEKRMAR